VRWLTNRLKAQLVLVHVAEEPAREAAATVRPLILSTPITGATVGVQYRYRVRVRGGKATALSLARSPAGMALDRRTRSITWTPAAPGRFRVVLRARAGRRRAGQAFTLVVTRPPSPAPQIVLAAGDIASCVGQGDEQTAAVLDATPHDVVLTLGDNAYDAGTPSEFSSCYAPSWGRRLSVTRPSPGNHDYATSGARGYFGYFGAAAGPSTAGYYSFDVGAWHLVALNSEIDAGSSSPQMAWLRADLAATSKRCVVAYWHKPRFTAGRYHDFTQYTALWQALHAAGAEIVLNGHDHNYQRFVSMTPAGVADPAGIRQFVVGTGGVGHYALRPDSRREAGVSGVFGVLRLALSESSYEWRFLPVAGGSYADAGSGTCR